MAAAALLGGCTALADFPALPNLDAATQAPPEAGAQEGGTAGQVFLFGGGMTEPSTGRTTCMRDTWVFEDGAWAEISPAVSPPEREAAALATLRGELVLFGGDDCIGDELSDTWTFDGSAWKAMSTATQTAPSPRGYAGMAEYHGGLILFGGYDNASDTSSADTWMWNGEAWSQLRPATIPTSRSGAAMATLNGTLLMFGGQYEDANGDTMTLGDTWTWTGTDWSELHPASQPAARYNGVIAARAGSLVLFGGVDASNNTLDDTWTWNGTTWVVDFPSTTPPAREAAAAAGGTTVVLFGGIDADNNTLDDTWTWDGSHWKKISATGPSARADSVMGAL